MILKSLTLTNFRVFDGSHTVELEPRHQESQKPSMVLFGGLNGAGKTSILAAIRLAFLGRISIDKGLSPKQYEESLTQLINKTALSKDGEAKASVQLILTYTQSGQQHELEITRIWSKGKKEKLALTLDGTPQKSKTYEQLQGMLFDLVPPGIADLFFFDGEQIASLAEDTSGNLLRQAVKRLLGLDLIARLNADIATYLNKKTTAKASKTIRDEIHALESECDRLEASSELSEQEATSIENQIQGIQNEIEEAESLLKTHGNEWSKGREEAIESRNQLQARQAQLKAELIHELDGYYPLSLAPNTMEMVLSQLEKEAKTREKQAFRSQLESYIGELNKKLTFDLSSSAPVALAAVQETLEEFADISAEPPILLDLSAREHQALELQHKRLASKSKNRHEEIQKELHHVSEELLQASDTASRAVDNSVLNSLLEDLRELDAQKAELVVQYRKHIEDARKATQERLDSARKLQKMHNVLRQTSMDINSIELAETTQNLLDHFSTELTKAKVRKLEEEFSEAYKKLARKEDLSIKARINPKTFDVELIDEQQHVINRKALSAGEKQIYAIAILDALGKVSGKRLPVVIDTPLGRLDSKHRDKLIEHYFPEASEQVIILSTDTEVDESFFNILKDDISHAYEILFNEHTKCSRLREGYFWEKSYKEAV